MATYQIRVCDDDENAPTIFDDSMIVSLDWQLVNNDVGAAMVQLPRQPEDLFYFMQTVIIERNVGRGFEAVENRRWFLMDWASAEDQNGNGITELLFYCSNALLDGRIILQNAKKTDYYDDLAKYYVAYNLGASAAATRLVTGISVAADVSAAPSATVEVGEKNLLQALREFSDASWEGGTYMVFDLVNTKPGLFEFRTFVGRMGEDHTAGGDDQRMVTLKNPRLESHFSKMANAVYCGGQGAGDSRVLKLATKTAWMASSKYARREIFVGANGVEDEDAVTAQAKAELYKNRPRKIITGEIVDEPAMMYGIDYGWGDLVTCSYNGEGIDCHIAAVGATYNDQGEVLTINVKGEIDE